MNPRCRSIRTALFAVLTFSCSACRSPLDAVRISIRVPDLPESWSVAGPCRWSLRWFDPDGKPQRLDDVGASAVIEIRSDSTFPVSAYPYWPDLGIPPGIAAPAGAVYPFGSDGGDLRLNWRGGVSAVFFRELLAAGGGASTDPSNFDWPRFRTLLESEDIEPRVRADPWSADWRGIAQKTRAAGFDRRRLVPRRTETVRIRPPAPGQWARASPFLPALDRDEDGMLSLEASVNPDAAFSLYGLLVFTDASSAWFPADNRAGLLAAPGTFE